MVIGYTPAREGFHSLLVAAPREGGTLRYVAELTAGFRASDQTPVLPRLARHTRTRPVVPCAKRATWVDPEMFCLVQFQQWTPNGGLRGASFRNWLTPDPSRAQRPVHPRG